MLEGATCTRCATILRNVTGCATRMDRCPDVRGECRGDRIGQYASSRLEARAVRTHLAGVGRNHDSDKGIVAAAWRRSRAHLLLLSRVARLETLAAFMAASVGICWQCGAALWQHIAVAPGAQPPGEVGLAREGDGLIAEGGLVGSQDETVGAESVGIGLANPALVTGGNGVEDSNGEIALSFTGG